MAYKSAFEAIADPTRRAILDSLADQGPRRAGDIAELFPQISRPAVSKHLRVLRGAELVRQEARGREVWYELRPGPLNEVQAWVRNYERFWGDKLQRLKEVAEEA
ncbi:MAG: ArsR family transcriptional regulator [Chloroflexi bacterium]|nr:metalloregulator ArsR/SmtB family transcription factor [Chloroflexota bacterium]MQC26857.1 ArsR family transcriptional regulator [Chloroflexota bacterium]